MQSASHAPSLFPERVGKYELLLPIGTGGMATVYLARTTGAGGFERQVALKLVHAHLRGDEESKLHLLEEAKLSALIRHPNVVPVQEVDEDPFGVFLVMDYVEGETLSGLARLAKNADIEFSWRLMARILNDALLGLQAAHDLLDTEGKPLNLVHRDFSPQNILIGIQGQTQLGDFGVAKAADRAVRTKTGLTKGKINYMSPEQARGRSVDRRCDVWAAGVVAWELLARRRMHSSDDDVATLLSIVTERPRRLSSAVTDVPKALDDAIAWALEPELERRCPDAETLRRALEATWAEGAGMATTAELAAFVRQVVNPELAARRAQIEHVLSSRRNATSAPRLRSFVPEQLQRDGHELDTRLELDPDAGRDDDAAPTRVLDTSLARRPREDLTETSAVVPTWAQPHGRQRRAVALAGLLGLGVLFAAWWWRDVPAPVEGARPSSDDPSAATQATPSPPEDAHPVSPPTPEPSVDEPAPDATAMDALPRLVEPPSSATPARRPNAAKRPPTGAAQRPTSGESVRPRVGQKPELASSPYGEPKSGE